MCWSAVLAVIALLVAPAATLSAEPAAGTSDLTLGSPAFAKHDGADGIGHVRPATVDEGAFPVYDDLRWSGWGDAIAQASGHVVPDGPSSGAPAPVELQAYDIGGCDGTRAYRRLKRRFKAGQGWTAWEKWDPRQTRGDSGSDDGTVCLHQTSGTSGPPPATCADNETHVGPLTVTASCFVVRGRTLVATGSISAAGVGIALDGTGELVIDPVAQKISATAPVTVSLGSLEIYHGDFDWSVQGHLHLPALPTLKIKGLPVAGSLDLQPAGDGVDAIAHVSIGDTAFTGDVTLHVNAAAGLSLDHLKLTLSEIPIKALVVKQASLEYHQADTGDVWTGSATVELPGELPTLTGTLEITDGSVSEASLSADDINKPIGTIVFLQKAGLDVRFTPQLKITGSIQLSAGPKLPVLQTKAATLDGQLSATFGNPVTIDAMGTVNIAGKVDLADARVHWALPDEFTFDGTFGFTFGPADAHVGAHAIFTPNGWAFRGDGDIKVADVSGQGFIYMSEKGMTGCVLVTAGPVDATAGFGYHWGGDIDLWFDDGCVGALDFKTAAQLSAAAGTRTLTVPRGHPEAVFAATGATSMPSYTLRSPSGQVVDPATGDQGPLDRGGYRILTDPARHATDIIVVHPMPGRWTFTPVPGSVPLDKVGRALAPPAARVITHVVPSHGRWLLRWKAPHVAGQSLRFIETGGTRSRILLTTTASRGAIRFRPADDGRADRRGIVVIVSQDGLPRAQLAGPVYLAPRPARPSRPPHLRLRVRKGSAVVTWGRATRAVGFRVVAVLRDGRRLYFQRARNRRRIAIRGVYAGDTVRLTVRAIGRDGLQSAPATRSSAHL